MKETEKHKVREEVEGGNKTAKETDTQIHTSHNTPQSPHEGGMNREQRR